MAHFYGTLQGARGRASRLGHKNTGLNTVAASWQGAVSVRLFHDGVRDMVEVRFQEWHGAGSDRLIYKGPVDGEENGAQ